MERSLAVFCVQSCCVFVPQDDDVFDPTTQQVTASLPTLSSSFYPSYYVLPPPSRNSFSVTSISPAQPFRAPPFHLLPLTSHQLPSPPTSFFQNASSPTRHRRCLCLGGMLCIHACLTKYAELKYTSSNESLLLLVEHDLELII